VIAITANAMKGDRDRCIAAGMDEFMAKPYRAEDLWRLVETYGAAYRASKSEAPRAAGQPLSRN
jgi:CheY-like chemotaxis protein